MGLWHQEEMRNALNRRGWRIVAEHAGDDRAISGSWELERSTNRPRQWIEFEGQDDLHCLTMPQSYGCHLRSDRSIGLYFPRQRSRATWRLDLLEFIDRLDRADSSECVSEAVAKVNDIDGQGCGR